MGLDITSYHYLSFHIIIINFRSNQSSEKYCYFFFDSKLTGMIQNEQNTAISKQFTKPAEYTHTTSGTILCADVWISGSQVTSLQNLVYTFRSFCF